MSLLAKEGVSIRDAMRIMGWSSYEMVKLYEKELEKAKKTADERAIKLVDRIEEFVIDIPECHKILAPTEASLRKLVKKYSNITIGRIFGISEAAIRKQLKKHGIERKKRIESADLNDKNIEKIRKELLIQ